MPRRNHAADQEHRKNKMLPPHVPRKLLRTYAELSQLAQLMTTDKAYNLVFLIGAMGLGKTMEFKTLLRNHPDAIKAPLAITDFNLSGVSLFEWAANNIGRLLVIDDVRTIYKDGTILPVLMALGQTEKVKTVTWRKQNNVLVSKGIPESFETTSSIIICHNQIDGMIDELAPLLDRGRIYLFNPSVEEVHQQAKKWVDPEIHDYIGLHLGEMPYPSQRWYFYAQEDKIAEKNWRAELLEYWYSTNPTLATFVEVNNNPSLVTQNARAAEFGRLGKLRDHACTRMSFYNYCRDYPHLCAKKSALATPEMVKAEAVEVGNVESEGAKHKKKTPAPKMTTTSQIDMG